MKYFSIAFVVAEILSIVLASSLFGFSTTLLLMLVFFIAGVMMIKHFGFSSSLMYKDIFESNNTNATSMYKLLMPIRYTLAAICFMLPGFFSDLIGILLVIPWLDKLFKFIPTSYQQTSYDDSIIDGEYTEIKTRDNDDITIKQNLEDKE